MFQGYLEVKVLGIVLYSKVLMKRYDKSPAIRAKHMQRKHLLQPMLSQGQNTALLAINVQGQNTAVLAIYSTGQNKKKDGNRKETGQNR